MSLKRQLSSDAGRPLKPPPGLNNLDCVVLGEEVDTGAGRLPRGARGTIVLVWRDGDAFEVEFSNPFPALVTLRPNQVRLAPRRAKP